MTEQSCDPANEKVAQIAISLEIPPSLILPPEEFCLGTSPRKAENSRPEANIAGSATVAASAEAVTGPTPGMVASRWLTALARCRL